MFIILGVHWKDWCWSWNSNTLATSWEELTHWKTLWCWEGLGAGGEGDDRGWDGWMTSPTPWTWVWVNSRSWWWTGKPGMLWFMGLQRVRHEWTELRKSPRNIVQTCQSLLKDLAETHWIGSKLGKEYIKAVYCPPAYLTYMQSQDCWEKYQQLQIYRWYHSNGRKWRGTKEPLGEGKRG